MAETKTKFTGEDVAAFLDAVPDPRRRADGKVVRAMMEEVTGEPPRMWGPSIVGCGRYHYRYDSGHEGDAPLSGFSPRARELVVYLSTCDPHREALLARLGKHKTGKSCLYLKSLADVDLDVLRELIASSMRATLAEYPD